MDFNDTKDEAKFRDEVILGYLLMQIKKSMLKTFTVLQK